MTKAAIREAPGLAGLMESYVASLKAPSFWMYSSWLELVAKYRGSILGLAWLVLPTALFVLLLGNVYSRLMDYPIREYIPYLATGYAIWRFMLHVVNDSASAFQSHKAFIMDGRVRLTDFLMRSFAKGGLQFAFSMLVVVVAVVWGRSWEGLASLLTLLVTLPLLLANLSWIAACVALVGARFPDTRDAIGTVMIAGFLLTPILWMIDRFPPDSLRGGLARLNPAYHLVDVVRAPVLGRMPETASIIAVVAMALVGWLLASLLYRRYARFVALWV